MSELKRYEVKTFDNYQESESGFWVRFQDAQQLQSQLLASQERVRLADERIKALQRRLLNEFIFTLPTEEQIEILQKRLENLEEIKVLQGQLNRSE